MKNECRTKKDQVMMNTDNRLLTRESSEHIREF
ncbi:DNA-binding protein, partial [Phocaeicola vulgatus]